MGWPIEVIAWVYFMPAKNEKQIEPCRSNCLLTTLVFIHLEKFMFEVQSARLDRNTENINSGIWKSFYRQVTFNVMVLMKVLETQIDLFDWKVSWLANSCFLHNGKCQIVPDFRGNGKSSYSFFIILNCPADRFNRVIYPKRDVMSDGYFNRFRSLYCNKGSSIYYVQNFFQNTDISYKRYISVMDNN